MGVGMDGGGCGDVGWSGVGGGEVFYCWVGFLEVACGEVGGKGRRVGEERVEEVGGDCGVCARGCWGFVCILELGV